MSTQKCLRMLRNTHRCPINDHATNYISTHRTVTRGPVACYCTARHLFHPPWCQSLVQKKKRNAATRWPLIAADKRAANAGSLKGRFSQSANTSHVCSHSAKQLQEQRHKCKMEWLTEWTLAYSRKQIWRITSPYAMKLNLNKQRYCF